MTSTTPSEWLRRIALYPLAVVYDAATALRNALFTHGYLAEHSFTTPTLCIGNLAVGGTGKTPHTELLLRLLLPTYRVAVLSRGYGRSTHGFLPVTASETAERVGDEPLQMQRKFPAARCFVCEDRVEGLRRITTQAYPEVDVVLLDDAFQHRYVRAGRTLLLTDYSRLYTRDLVLPAGNLRESKRGARRADLIVVTKAPSDLGEAARGRIARELAPRAHQHVVFTTLRYATPYPLFPPAGDSISNGANKATGAVGDSANTAHGGESPHAILLLTGIAHPEPLVRHYEALGAQRVEQLHYPDHHAFTAADLRHIEAAFAALPRPAQVVTTEKDAQRLLAHAPQLSPGLRAGIMVQPVAPAFISPADQELFNNTLLDYVSTHSRNRRMD